MIRNLVIVHDTIVGFNLQYDLQWLWKLGISTEGKRYWCCQVAEFILNNQTTPYPSLDSVAEKYFNEHKLDVVSTEYWDKGINTDEIPWAILSEYAEKDAELTEKVYLKQKELMPASKRNLVSLNMQDMATLAEMRMAGMKLDETYAQQQQASLLSEIESVRVELDLLHSVPSFNWSSNDHLSALLYGGVIVEKVRKPVGVYKSGLKVGQPRYRIEEVEYHLPRMYQPIKNSAMSKAGVWSTSEDTLVKLNDGSTLISGILKIRELTKLYGTYFAGIPQRILDSHWPIGMVHGSFNQCVAVTGRLTSTKPNLQNMPEAALKMIVSRF